MTFWSSLARGQRVQYDYRAPDGRLFSCVAKSLEVARNRRDAWLAAIDGEIEVRTQ